MNILRTTAWLVAWLMGASWAAADTVAITEFFNQPIGERGGRQWIELFNYGSAPVEMKGWRISGGGNNLLDIDKPFSIQPGDYAIIVCYYNGLPRSQIKQVFETEWLGGRGDPRVFVATQGNFRMGTGGEITLQNVRRQAVWSLFFRNDGTPGRATFFAMNNFRLLKKFGGPGQPGVIRKGTDAGITGGEFPGYEGNDKTEDPLAFQSDVAGLMQGFDSLYGPEGPEGQAQPGFGSPLRGNYTAAGAK